jgi:Do/DeqQ family serine protease
MFLSLLGVAVLLVGALAGSAITAKGWFSFKGAGENKVPIYLAADQRVNQAVNLPTGFSAVAKAVTPAVVTVEVSSRARQQSFPLFIDPFRDFFGPDQDDEQMPRRRSPRQPAPRDRAPLRPSGLGSGVIVSPDGYILTNNHVVEGGERVEVQLNDRRTFTAKVVGTDPPTDVAVLKIEGSGLPTIPLGDSNQVEVGDVVLAIGNPLNVGQTVTMGIISAKSRRTGAGSGASYEDFLQTDAAINRGNSGGALVNLRGELIGIPSQILGSLTGGNIGIGFAIPTHMARQVMEQLIKSGKVRRGMLGIRLNTGPLTPALAEHFGYKGTKGAVVQDVDPGQPAERAGVKPGDIITEVQGQPIEDGAQLRNLIAQMAPGTTIKLKVWRDGAVRELTATLAELDPKLAAGALPGESGEASGAASGALSGVQVENLTANLARRLGLPPTVRGVVITDIEDDSNAAEAGLLRGDVIEEVNRQPVANLNEFTAALQRAGKKSVLLRVRGARNGQMGAFYVVVQAQE